MIPVLIIAILCSSHALQGCDSNEHEFKAEPAYGNLLDVKTNPNLQSDFLQYTGMDISFNPETHIPNWVAWELTNEEASASGNREDNFRPDPYVRGCAQLSDYRGSGYDRGHMAPAGDFKWSAQAQDDTFFLTNICPQAHALNGGAWLKLEEKCRIWAKVDEKIYIICGPIIDDTPKEYIGENKVWVPRRFFKVILAPYSTPPRGIGFIMPNSYVEGGMQPCAVSIDEVEAITGHDFFHTLPDDIEAELERQNSFTQWSTIR